MPLEDFGKLKVAMTAPRNRWAKHAAEREALAEQRALAGHCLGIRSLSRGRNTTEVLAEPLPAEVAELVRSVASSINVDRVETTAREVEEQDVEPDVEPDWVQVEPEKPKVPEWLPMLQPSEQDEDASKREVKRQYWHDRQTDRMKVRFTSY